MFLVELLEVFFAPFVLIYKLFIPDSETGKATISGYVFVPLGLVFGSVLLLGLLWSLAVAFFPKFAPAPAPQPEKPKSVIVQKADQIAIYSEKVTGKADEYLGETPEAAQKRTQLQNKLKKANSFLKNVQKLTNDIAK